MIGQNLPNLENSRNLHEQQPKKFIKQLRRITARFLQQQRFALIEEQHKDTYGCMVLLWPTYVSIRDRIFYT